MRNRSMANKLAAVIVVSLLGAVAVSALQGADNAYSSSPTPRGPPSVSPPPITASPPASPPNANTPIKATPPPSPSTVSPPVQVPPSPSTSPPWASPPVQTPPPPSPPVQAPPPPPPSPVRASPPVQSPPSPSPPVQTPPPPSPSSVSPPVQTPPPPRPPNASPAPMQASPPPSASTPVQASPPSSVVPGLTVNFYKQSCPRAEEIVSNVVRKATSLNAGIGGGLIRLAFHDCFVQGCDASVLLDPTPANPQPEKLGVPNYQSLRGYEVIDEAKATLEAACPGTVSCADIVQFAARDATNFLSNGRISFQTPGGRRDGRVSLASETLTYLPPPFATLPQLISGFNAKGLTVDDLVVLSGAHSVGQSRCSSFYDRIMSSSSSSRRSYSDMSTLLSVRVRRQCPAASKPTTPTASNNDPMVAQLDVMTPNTMDNQYYRNVISGNVLFGSDAALMASDQTSQMVFFNAYDPARWERKFAAAMVKMASIDVKTGASGEVRRNCRVVN